MTMTGRQGKKVLLCGHRSFAARGLTDILTGAGYDVTCFSRGREGRDGAIVYGPAVDISSNPQLDDRYDILINYILLKDESIDENIKYIDALIDVCRTRNVSRLVHISSISVFRAEERRVTEASDVETVPSRKGSYGSLKVAQDLRIIDKAPQDLAVSFVRPGFILGDGLVNPIVGTGLKLPWNSILAVGDAGNSMPLIRRDLVNEAILRIIDLEPRGTREVFLLVHSKSPSRKVYLDTCCGRLGCGRNVISVPVAVWYLAGAFGEVAAPLIGRSGMKPLGKIKGVCRKQVFDPSGTAGRLGMDFSFDWPAALEESMDGQIRNFDLPEAPSLLTGKELGKVTYLGFGRIVKQKHLPALTKGGFLGEIEAYDIRSYIDESGRAVRSLSEGGPGDSELFVVATPGPCHSEAIDYLKEHDCPVIVEKPLCYSQAEFDRWLEFAESRKSPVLVCHNYRFKANVLEMINMLRRFNPGTLLHAEVHFSSPPVINEKAGYLRNERAAKTLFHDYSLHFLDIACMFGKGTWDLKDVDWRLNSRGETALIKGRVSCSAYDVNFFLRQGFGRRQASVLFHFQNYSAGVTFFPDAFYLRMADDGPFMHLGQSLASARAVVRKVADKLSRGDSDLSHARVIGAAVRLGSHGISVSELSEFYRMLFKVGEDVYRI